MLKTCWVLIALWYVPPLNTTLRIQLRTSLQKIMLVNPVIANQDWKCKLPLLLAGHPPMTVTITQLQTKGIELVMMGYGGKMLKIVQILWGLMTTSWCWKAVTCNGRHEVPQWNAWCNLRKSKRVLSGKEYDAQLRKWSLVVLGKFGQKTWDSITASRDISMNTKKKNIYYEEMGTAIIFQIRVWRL